MLLFDNNIELESNLKKLNSEHLIKSNTWVIDVLNLYFLLLQYKGRNDIFFQFDGDEKEKFREKYKKALAKHEKDIAERNRIKQKNEYAIKFKKLLEEQKHDINKYSHIFKKGIIPYNHQIVSAEFLNEIKSGILALEMGLGKTLTIVFSCELDSNIKKVLCITPNSLKQTFADDIDKFFGLPYYIINSKNNKYTIEEAKYFIVNFEYFQRSDFNISKKLKPYGLDKNIDAIAIDESHKIANSKSNRTKCITKTFSYVPKKILSSGTPIKSEADELFTQLKFIDSKTFSNKTKFLNTYCGKFYNPNTGTYFVNKSKMQLDELHQKLQSYMIRYKTDEVIDLPEMIFNNIKLEMSDAEYKEYLEIEEGVVYDLETNQYKLAQKIVIIGKLRKFLSSLKIKYLKELIDDIISDDEKIVFIDFFKDSIKELKNVYKDSCVLHYGDQKLDERTQSINDWKTKNNVKIFAGSSSTTKEGLTLTEAKYMILNTLEWTPADCDQIFKRINRIGQERICQYFIPLFDNTIDVDIHNLVMTKKEIFSKLIDNETLNNNINEHAIDEIIGKIRERKIKRAA